MATREGKAQPPTPKPGFWLLLLIFFGLGFYFFWKKPDSNTMAEKAVDKRNQESRGEDQKLTHQRGQQQKPRDSGGGRHPTNQNSYTEIMTEDDFRKTYGTEWRFSRNNQKRISRVFGGQIAGIGNDWERVYQFGQSVAGLFGVGVADLKPQRGEAGESARTEGFRINQSHDGFDVYQGNMVLFIKKDDGSLFMINNNLKPIGDYDREIKVSVAEAESYLRSELQDKDLRELAADPRPILYSSGSQAQLGWLFTVTLGREKFVHEIVVSTQTLSILSRLDFTSF